MTGLTLRASVPALMGRNSLDQLFDAFFSNPMPQIEKTTQGYPLTDIYKDDDGNQIIEMALAGFAKEEISIQCAPNKTLIISSERMDGITPNQALSGRRIARRRFTKSFVDYYNQLDFGSSTATFENGLLRVKIPPIDAEEYAKIEIK
jgi:HSP20 family molecular chaperone IbpA